MTNPKHTDTSRSGDLVEELRLWRLQSTDEIADLIETQAREIERLREALADMVTYSVFSEAWQDRHPEYVERARAALAGDSHD